MDSNNPTTGEFRLDEPEDVVSSQRPPMRRRGGDDEGRPPRLFGFSRTVWAIVAVVAVIVGGVAVVQYTTRSPSYTAQDTSLSGLEITIPEPSASDASPPVSPTPEPSASKRPKATATPSASATEGTPAPENNGQTGPGRPATPSGPTGGTDPQPSSGPADEQDEPTSRPDDDQDDNGGWDGWDDGDDNEGQDQGQDDDQGQNPGPETGPGQVPVADPGVNLAASASAQASSASWGLGAGNVTDGSTRTYWESRPGFPQTLTVDLGQVTTVGRVALSSPSFGWGPRTQTITVLGSTDGSSYRTLKGSSAYQFPNSGSQATATFTPTATRYLQLRFTGATQYGSAQLAGLSVHSS
ncbi:hypothetical protein Kisp01_29180 [Kineosporia sp. NBRC 101677]|uniref:discoidin domain-containing protein n=1 Tax=Kineosporia sp. NBRC 101677 TaxID=3032197 RepID=UPI0024A03890|nr:discoidin domain-containing protein [Kineosporia sp. NBRC 101677]GLY15903.1 hypothetical protein Kisp01_29180 [Kineosporia sp. NBRC 101677]